MTNHRELLAVDAARFAEARAAVERAKFDLKARVLIAHCDGVPEAEIARLAGVDRMTVRKWVGKL